MPVRRSRNCLSCPASGRIQCSFDHLVVYLSELAQQTHPSALYPGGVLCIFLMLLVSFQIKPLSVVVLVQSGHFPVSMPEISEYRGMLAIGKSKAFSAV